MNANAIVLQQVQQEEVASIGITTEVSWIAPPEMTYEQWSGVGSTFQQISRSINWWIGDWLNTGELRWGEMAMQAVEETGRGVDSLLKCKAVATRFQPETRLDGLSWSHHRAVAYLDPLERDEWLGAAIAYQISTRDLNAIARFDKQQRHTLLKSASNGVSMAEFARLFDLVRLDKEQDARRTTVNGQSFEGEYPGQYDEEEDGLPFDSLRAKDGDGDEDEVFDLPPCESMDIEEVFAFFEDGGIPLKIIRADEVMWEGIAVRAQLDDFGLAVLVWEKIP